MLNKLLLILIFAWPAKCLFAQAEKTYPLAHYNFNNGLAAYNANTIIQDRQGFIWIGTINGLQRFDGHRFLTFRRNPEDKKSLPDNYIDHLFYDSKGNLWTVLGNGEIGIFDTRKFTYTGANLAVKDERTLKLPRRLMEDSNGNLLYIFNGFEVTTYNTKLRQFSAAHNRFKLPENWKVISLVEDPSTKKYWMATDSGMCVFDNRSHQLSYRGHNTENIAFIEKFGNNAQFLNLKIDNSSRFWYTNHSAENNVSLINCYDLKTDKSLLDRQNLISDIKRNYEVKRILRQEDGRVWIAGINILMKFNEPEKKFRPVFEGRAEKNIDFQEVNCVFEDRDRNIWISTDDNGVYVFKPSTQLFTSVKHVNRSSKREDEGSIIALAHNNRELMIASVSGDGIHKYDKELNPLPDYLHSDDEKKPFTIWNMCRLRNNRTFWMGLQSGILVYDVNTGQADHFNPALFRNRLVRSIAEDHNGNIWLATPAAGLFKWNAKKGRVNFESGFSKVPNTPNRLIEKINVDSKGYVWVSTLMDGVYKIDPANDSILKHLTTTGPTSKRLMADAVTDAFEYNDSIMIFLTGALNIYNTRTDSVTWISSANGLPSDIVRCIEKDNKNYLWLGLFNGLCRMNFEKRSYTYYDRNDGMTNDNFNYSSSSHLPDGRLAFGTTSDFIVFNPDDLNTNKRPPDVTITEFRLLNKPVSVDSLHRFPKVELGPDQNFITIGFSGLSYFNNKWSYYYMLEGLDKQWKKANELNQVEYNFLPPGSYTFKVKAENADGLSSEKITELEIKVQPPIWKTWWFYSLIILLLAILLYQIDRERMRRKAAMQKMRSDIADNLHEEVNTALNKINILSEMARIKSDKDPMKSQDYFEQIHKKSHDMIIAMDDMLWSIDPVNDSMEKTVERIKEYIDALKRRYTVNIELLIDKKAEMLMLNMKLRHDVFILMKAGIKSVVEAGTKNCRIHIGMQKDSFLYTIDIDNEDCDLQQLKNLLQQRDLEKRLQAINATLSSYMHQYTSIFELQVPLD